MLILDEKLTASDFSLKHMSSGFFTLDHPVESIIFHSKHDVCLTFELLENCY